MKRGLLSVSLMALVCLASPVLADDTCGPAGCDAAQGGAGPSRSVRRPVRLEEGGLAPGCFKTPGDSD